MAEPQPSGIHEGEQVSEGAPAPGSSTAEDRKAAAALSNLDAVAEPDGKGKTQNMEALGKAMKDLDVSKGTGASAKPTSGPQAASKAVEMKKNVKVDAADVALLAEALDISKPKATELLKTHNADAVTAMKAWVAAS